ncbi:MAG TPA: LPS export ABC transporter ATP-binding protein [bacterium]|nr:LPS export ABC transporter ATP-binding protein [bacterium]
MNRTGPFEPAAGRLRAEGLVKRYNGRTVVDRVSLAAGAGEIVGLLGPNGAGKTTTFYMIVGLVRPDAGEVWIGETAVTGEPVDVRIRAGVGYLAQEPSIFRRLTVVENVLLVLEQREPSRTAREARAGELLDEFHLRDLARQPAWTLSGGERRRVEIARALALDPSFLLLDEPFTGIDPISIQDLQRTVRYLSERGLGVIITDHNVRETLQITDRAAIIHDGRIVASGTPERILDSPEARQVYLGEGFRL